MGSAIVVKPLVHLYASNGVPLEAERVTILAIKRVISASCAPLTPAPSATFGTRLRYLRKRLRVTIAQFATLTGLSHNVIARIERDETRMVQPWILGRILPFVESRFKEAFPDANGDPSDYLIPPKNFGGWLKNFRLRKGLQQKQLAALLAVKRETIRRYENGMSRPDEKVQAQLRKITNAEDFKKFIRES